MDSTDADVPCTRRSPPGKESEGAAPECWFWSCQRRQCPWTRPWRMDSTDADVSRGRHSRSPALNPDRTGCYARHHFNMGKAMVPLRDEGALTIGSGTATHNLRKRSLAQRGASRWKIQRGEQLLAWRRHLMLEWHSHGRTASIHCNVTLGASCRGKG